MNNHIISEQKQVCDKFGAEFLESPPGWKLGISKNINSGKMPINGLRHKPENGTVGWYIWAGDYTNDPEFFESMHVEHIDELYPQISKYLGLAPGWRFQIDGKGYEDVWKDESLLN
jgi:hypothetical protein